jgi:type VI secretion system secreted protein Hcp
MALDIFLKLGDLKGESTDKTHRKEIDVINWSWGMTNAGSAHVGGGAGVGKGDVKDLEVTKYVDTSSPKLMLACCQCTHFPSALLTVRKSSGRGSIEYYKVKMEEVVITYIKSNAVKSRFSQTENVCLNFAKVSVDYTPQKADGSADTTKTFGWDVAANSKLE